MSSCNTGHLNETTLSVQQNVILNVDQIKRDLLHLDLSTQYKPTDSIAEYFTLYGINFEKVRHYFGYFESKNERIIAHVFIPQNPIATIFFIHGYLDHSVASKNLIARCLQRNFAVATYDLPGHGLSSGERASIGDFSEYATTLHNFSTKYSEYLPRPFHLIAHSTGCAIAYEFLYHSNNTAFEKVIFLAPLVRNSQWSLSLLGYYLARPFVKTLPRKYRENSSDQEYLTFINNDQLQNKYISMKFLHALHVWNNRINGYDILFKPILIIQGTSDDVVDWRYNLNFFEQKIRKVKIKLIEKGKHQLANEGYPQKQQVYDSIFNYL